MHSLLTYKQAIPAINATPSQNFCIAFHNHQAKNSTLNQPERGGIEINQFGA